MWWPTRSLLESLDDLPDEPQLGVKLMIAGLAIFAVSYAWARLGFASFQRASTFITLHSPSQYPSPDDLNGYLIFAGATCFLSGAFIFLGRGVWWWSEWRNERDIVRLKLR
jgi:hypothetical protein